LAHRRAEHKVSLGKLLNAPEIWTYVSISYLPPFFLLIAMVLRATGWNDADVGDSHEGPLMTREKPHFSLK
jgi:hypothetical protein